jgi:hypothetical protein
MNKKQLDGPKGIRILLYFAIPRSYKDRIGQIGLSPSRGTSRDHMGGRRFKSRARNHLQANRSLAFRFEVTA